MAQCVNDAEELQVSFCPVVAPSISGVLRERASLQPNTPAITYVDYDQDWDGVRETLTWSQLYRRVVNVADKLRSVGSIGDRAVILAPQGLHYVVGFLGALEAGIVAVPLPAPGGGAHDERTVAVMQDTSPTVILTTSNVVEHAAGYGQVVPDHPDPSVVEIDALDLDSAKRTRVPGARPVRHTPGDPVYLQYTSGSTRTPAGVAISNENAFANFAQIMRDYFAMDGGAPPEGISIVTWLPLYHDMGMLMGLVMPVLTGLYTVLTSPAGFLQRPARWLHLLSDTGLALSGGPNFAYDLAARRTSDEDMEGVDLSQVYALYNGAERVQPATLKRFGDRFAKYNLPLESLRPAYGMAEATVYVAQRNVGEPPLTVWFDADKLPSGEAVRTSEENGTPLLSYGAADSQLVRIVDPDTCVQLQDGLVGEIWIQGDNVAAGYWRKPEESKRTFGAKIVNPSEGTPEGPWLRSGDSGFFSEGDLFIMGRIKDLLIVYGRNHAPDDIETTIQEISPGRCAAIAVPQDGVEKLAAIIEIKQKKDESAEDLAERLGILKRDITTAVFNAHGLNVADLVMVPPGSIPITTSGKIRRQQSVQMYEDKAFARLDS